ncbi:toxin-antitoxin system protein [Porphyromonas gulae]|uniref:toxin-antitoxin system protein n=1 Tax=Porphyromonas gulae TaxID=111105 RepID=UPI00242A8948|nr:toxin-antitoxin system protein [Porphyromonas gulae]
MGSFGTKEATSIRIDAGLLAQIKQEAKADNRSFSNYLEVLLYRMGYRIYNEETIQACREVMKGNVAGVVDTSSREAMELSLFGDDAEG